MGKGFQYMQNNSQILLCVSLDGELGLCPKAREELGDGDAGRAQSRKVSEL